MESLMSKNMRKIMKYSVTIQDISCEFGLALKRKKKSFRKRGVIKTKNFKNYKIHNEHDLKSELPIDTILDISAYTKIKTQE